MQTETNKEDVLLSENEESFNCLTTHQTNSGGIYRRYIKRPMDFILALCAIIVLSPILLVVALLVRIKLGRPVIFKQQRPGLNEKIFTLYKFRTMTDNRDENGELLPDSIRLIKFGRMLRSTSLDELPELFNILKGDMSVIGPRPQLIKDMVFMTPEQRKRHSVIPGLSGWAQINGRNDMTWEEKLKLDLDYVQNVSFLGDVKIIFITFLKVFKREGISAEGMDTAEDLGDYLLRRKKINEEEYHAGLNQAKCFISN
jgi:undecaprenyl phosphate N,N'-diacetylbacillosamine 1-phosphate transferase